MGKRGPKPEPTKLRILKGNPGKRPLNDREPKVSGKMPSPPIWLMPEAKREWRRVGPWLYSQGLLSAEYRAAFAAYCQSWARWVEAERLESELGLETAIMKGVRTAAKDAKAVMKRYLALFGLSPTDVTGLKATPDANKDKKKKNRFQIH